MQNNFKFKIISTVAFIVACGFLLNATNKTDNGLQQDQGLKPQKVYKRIVVATTSYNNSKWYKQNIESFLAQDYPNKIMLYTDANSPDGTGKLVQDYIRENHLEDLIIFKQNTKRKGSLENHYDQIHSCRKDDIVIIYDGDDLFEDNHVLSYVNGIYQDPKVWLTYGQFRFMSTGAKGFCAPMPLNVVRSNTFREGTMHPSHLRTFYAGLFQKIKKEDMMMDGEFFAMTGDVATMIPMIEMARDGHFKFVPKVLYVYNDLNPINDNKVNRELQYRTDLHIRSSRKYDKIESPFVD